MSKRGVTPVPAAGLTRKQLSRAQREARLRRWVLIIFGSAVTAVIGVLIFGLIYEQNIAPNRVVATVNGEEITVRQLQARMRYDAYFQLSGQPLSLFGIDPALLGQFSLESLVDEALLRQKAAELGVEVSDADVEEEIQLTFGYDAGEPEPTATPTPRQAQRTPTVTPTFVHTLTPTPLATLAPGVTPTVTPTATRTPAGTPTLTPTPTPPPTREPLTEESYNTNFLAFLETASAGTGLSIDEVRELYYNEVRITLLRERLVEDLGIEADETKLMAHVAQMIVATEEEALAALDRIAAGEDFAVVAAEVSLDTSSAYRGGDLGWVERGDLAGVFGDVVEETVFSIAIGEVSIPIPTQNGWHVIMVYEREDVRTTPLERASQQQERLEDMLIQWRGEAEIVEQDFWVNYLPDLP